MSATGLTSLLKTCMRSFTVCPLGSLMWLHAGQCGAGGQGKLPQKVLEERGECACQGDSAKLKCSNKVYIMS